MVSRHPAMPETNRLQAAKLDVATTRATERFPDEKRMTLNKIVADTPPRNADTNEICSATATT